MLWRYTTQLRADGVHLAGRPDRGHRGHPVPVLGLRPAHLPGVPAPPGAGLAAGPGPVDRRRGGAVLAVGHLRRRLLGGVPGHGRRAGRDHPLRLHPGPPRTPRPGPGAATRGPRSSRAQRSQQSTPRTRRDSHDLQRAVRGRPAAAGHRAPAGPGAVPAHPAEHRRAAVRRRAVGEQGQGRARRVRRDPARRGRAGALLRAAAGRDAGAARGPGVRARPGVHPRAPRPALVGPLRELFDGPGRAAAWPSTWSAGCSRPTCGRCGPRA